jgi:stearoyl-CoA desaturase (Delta-9 desaturase)
VSPNSLSSGAVSPASSGRPSHSPGKPNPHDPIRLGASLPFFLIHLAPLGALVTGTRWQDWAMCLALYYVRMFFITAGYHRYFAHKSYKMGRVMQFLMAFGAQASVQKGALWWAAHHRHHHRHSDDAYDIHSPKQGFLWSHVKWVLVGRYDETRFDLIPDFAKYPELRFLNRHHWIPGAVLGAAVWAWGGWSGLWIGFFLSTVLLYHGTYLVNSAAHVFGTRRYATTDTSRNCWWIALLTTGEGWHNNHHHFQGSANQGFYWYEVDATYYVLKTLSLFGLVRQLRKPPKDVMNKNRIDRGAPDLAMEQDRAEKLAKSA